MSLTSRLNIKGNWQMVVDDCRTTVSKPPLGKEPSSSFKRGILIAEHSPIRDIHIRWCWLSIKSWIATHFARHKWECFISTQRNDRQQRYDRNSAPQDAPVDFSGDANAQALIDTSRKRLCRMAAPETRTYWEDLKREVRAVEPEISDVMVPNCVYRGGCPELGGCKFYAAFVERCLTDEGLTMEELTDIHVRYAAYNRMFYDI